MTRAVKAFVRARALLHHEVYRPIALGELKKAGLSDPGLLLELEKIVKSYQDHIKQREDLQKLAEKEARRK